jgi:hypothetical protein
MGCCKSKSASATAPEIKAEGTLLDAPATKSAPATFNVFLDVMDSIKTCESMVPAENDTKLQVDCVQGGAFGRWNNRPATEKVAKGDFVVKLRNVHAGEWIAGDSRKMLDALASGCLFEVEIQHAVAPTSDKTSQEQTMQVPTASAASLEAQPADSLKPSLDEAQDVQVLEEKEVEKVAGADMAPDTTPEVQDGAVQDEVTEENGVAAKGGCPKLFC